MTKKELIEVVASKTGLTRADVERTYNVLVETVIEETKKGEMRIDGIGTLKVVTRAARVAKNPRTNEVINVPEKKVVTFKAGKALKSL